MCRDQSDHNTSKEPKNPTGSSLVHLMYHVDPSDFGWLILIQIKPKEFFVSRSTCIFDCDRQLAIGLKLGNWQQESTCTVMHFSCFFSYFFMFVLFHRLLISLTVTVVYQ